MYPQGTMCQAIVSEPPSSISPWLIYGFSHSTVFDADLDLSSLLIELVHSYPLFGHSTTGALLHDSIELSELKRPFTVLAASESLWLHKFFLFKDLYLISHPLYSLNVFISVFRYLEQIQAKVSKAVCDVINTLRSSSDTTDKVKMLDKDLYKEVAFSRLEIELQDHVVGT